MAHQTIKISSSRLVHVEHVFDDDGPSVNIIVEGVRPINVSPEIDALHNGLRESGVSASAAAMVVSEVEEIIERFGLIEVLARVSRAVRK